MTALLLHPDRAGYAPAIQARLETERALARAMPLSASLVLAALVAVAFGARMLPAGAPVRDAGPAVHDMGQFELRIPPALLPPASTPAQVTPPDAHATVTPVPDPIAPAEPPASPDAGGRESGVQGGAVAPEGGETSGALGPVEAPPQPGDVFMGEQLPERVSTPAPRYPDFAREAGVEGTVVLWALVGRQGGVDDVRVMRSVPLLDDAAVSAVRRWRFTPALANGHAVPVWIAVPVRFTLH